VFSATNLVALVGALGILLLTIELLRRRQLREKYAALWLVVSAVALALAVFPGLLDWLSSTLGFGLPVNFLFFVAFLVLLFVSMQLSLETGRREDETERLAEEVALLREIVARLESRERGRDRDDGEGSR
jgi:hypothetical protein